MNDLRKAAEPEPVAWMYHTFGEVRFAEKLPSPGMHKTESVALYTAPPQRKPLTEREVALLDGMIEVQLHHANQCDGIQNRTMAEKQKCWDMERVELLRKLRKGGLRNE